MKRNCQKSIKLKACPERSRMGFALIYVILFIGLISIAMAMIASSLSLNLRMVRKTESTAEAYQLARSGITNALNDYQINNAINCNQSSNPVTIGAGSYIYNICDGYVTSVGEVKTNGKTAKVKLKADVDKNSYTDNHDITDNIQTIYQVGN